ncbi:MAG: FAD-dependent oxidoreductase [Pseudomonadota bacterium]
MSEAGNGPSEYYDLIVVGGGINGVAVAQAASAKGHSVLLLEKSSLAAGTSRASSKLIHGGLRYLESYEFSLVYEALRERAMMLRNAPDLVALKKFHIPVYRHTRRAPWLIFAGLSLYALCDRLRPSSRFRVVPKSEWHELDGIETKDLRAVFQYQDAQTDDVELTRAVMNSAVELGATLMEKTRLLSAHWHNDHFSVLVEKEGARINFQCAAIVNAGGPWVNRINECIEPAPRILGIDLIQGTHVVLEGQMSERFYYVESPRDGRAVFVMPWYENTLIGTTEARFSGNPDDIKALDSSVRYLLGVFRHYFPNFNDGANAKIISRMAGARVLPEAKTSAFKRSRETILYWQPDFTANGPAVCSIYGGKLTAWRATAEKVLKTIQATLPAPTSDIDTKTLPLRRTEQDQKS